MDQRYMTPSDVSGMERAMEDMLCAPSGKQIFRVYAQKPIDQTPLVSMRSLEELLEIDEQRAKDGFPKKIKIGQVLAGPGKVIMVPYVEEARLIHGEFEPKSEDGENGDIGEQAGHGQGNVGDVIGETPIQGEGEGGEDGEGDPKAGKGRGDHGIEAEAYKLGKELSEKFQLPNLRDKGKKVPTDEYVYDLIDRHPGSGQVLDKKETLKSIIKTNLVLGRLDKDNIDMTNLIVGPNDKVYRVLSREKVWKSQAVVFFLRDYSGSMSGEPTRAILTQHLMIYAWLLVQYDKLVIPRFIVHDTEAEEKTAEEYFRLSSGGGTKIASGYEVINKIVEGEALARDYNIYVFQGTDGEDWDKEGVEPLREIQKILGYANRMGVTVLKGHYYGDRKTEYEEYIAKGNILERKDLFRMYVMSQADVTDEKNIEAIKALIAQD